MTQIGEPIMTGFVNSGESKEECSHAENKKQWRCNLEGETTGHLTRNIVRDKCGSEPEWPSQAHHLIPWKQLKKHKVAHYLSKKKNKLLEDNNYSVNHGKNGYFMPYASIAPQWETASEKKKQRIAEKIMDDTGIQLHQSKHSHEAYLCAEQGYKAAVDKYLEIILKEIVRHYDVCEVCKSKKQGNKQPARKAVVTFVDKASQLLKRDIQNNRIFVSYRAAVWGCKNR